MVKYADSPTTDAVAEIDAPPAAVWPLLCDINLPARFSDEFQRAEWIDEGPAAGAAFRGYNRHPKMGMEWDVVCTVTDYQPEQPEQVFEWSIGEPTSGRWRFELTSSADGQGSTLRFVAVMGPGPSGLTPAIEKMPDREEDIVARRLEEWSANMAATVDGIKALAEGGDTDGRDGTAG